MKSINKTTLKNFTILIVEDDLSVNDSLKLFLEAKLAKVLEATDGIDALNILELNSVDFIISDIEMPKLNGIELITKVREKNSTIPIVIISSYDEKEYLLKAIKLNLIDYIVKPITINKLENLLSEITEKFSNTTLTTYYFREVEGEYNSFTKEITYKNSIVQKLTKKESALLDLLIENRNTQVHKNLVDDIVFQGQMSDSALRTLLYRVRKLIGKNSIESISSTDSYRIHINS